MALLTIDLNCEKDLRYSSKIIKRRLAELVPHAAANAGNNCEAGEEDSEKKAARLTLMRPHVEQLLRTRTWKILISPFSKRLFPNAATIEEIGAIMPIKAGVDATRKAHTVKASLGKWEGRTGIKIFVPVSGRPQRYKLNPDVYDLAKVVLEEQKKSAGK